MLTNKVAIITGSGRGIGKCIAKEFVKQGAKVVISARSRSELDETAKEIGENAFPVICDVSSEEQVKNLVSKTIEKFGRIDILMTCAGIYGPIGKLEENNSNDWVNTFKINLFGTMFCAKAVIPHMKNQKNGKIIFMSGAGAPKPFPHFSAYSASKTAIVNLAETLSEELKDSCIDVNAVAPGLVFTRLQDSLFDAGEKAGQAFLEKMKREKEKGGVPPEKAAELAIFLASEESNGITGRLISAVHDNYKEWNAENIKNSESFVIRRIDNFFFKKIK